MALTDFIASGRCIETGLAPEGGFTDGDQASVRDAMDSAGTRT